MLHSQSDWVKVHAAEYLLWAGFPAEVRTVFLEEEQRFGHQPPYRIGIWRVLAQAAPTVKERAIWLDRIQQAFQDTLGPDRVHAAETLAKLGTPVAAPANVTKRAVESNDKALSLYTQWALAHQSAGATVRTCRLFLGKLTARQSDAATRRLSAYSLRHLGQMTGAQWRHLAQTALVESDSSGVKTHLLSAAFVQAPASAADTRLFVRIRDQLLSVQKSPHKVDRTELAMALARRGTPNELPVLVAMLSNQSPLLGISSNASAEALLQTPDNADVRAAAAYAILRVQQRFN